MMDCIFCKIISGDIKSQRVYEDEDMVVIEDISPKAPIHFLLIPKRHIATLNDLTQDDAKLAGRMVLVAAALAKGNHIDESGYRTVINCNREGGQTVFHLHLHLLGGRQLGGSMVA